MGFILTVPENLRCNDFRLPKDGKGSETDVKYAWYFMNVIANMNQFYKRSLDGLTAAQVDLAGYQRNIVKYFTHADQAKQVLVSEQQKRAFGMHIGLSVTMILASMIPFGVGEAAILPASLALSAETWGFLGPAAAGLVSLQSAGQGLAIDLTSKDSS